MLKTRLTIHGKIGTIVHAAFFTCVNINGGGGGVGRAAVYCPCQIGDHTFFFAYDNKGGGGGVVAEDYIICLLRLRYGLNQH